MFGQRLFNARKAKDLTLEQLAQIYNERFNGGLSKGTLSKYENGKQEPMISTVGNLASILGVSVDYLIHYDEDVSESSNYVKIPVLRQFQAEIPTEAIENIIDYEEIPREMAMRGEYFGLKIKGESMSPRMLEDDVIIVRKQSDVDSGDIAVVLVNGDDATVKKIRKSVTGIELVPLNPTFDIMFYSNEEIETLPVVVIGKVVELRRKF